MADSVGHGNEALKAGDYKLERFVLYSLVNGSEIELNNLYRYIEIYEDIFSPYISAKLHIEDAMNFPERLPITGQEKVEIEFRSDINSMEPVKLVFRVYKLDSQRISETGKTQQYVLHLMSEGGYFNFSQICGYALSGSVSEMVKSILYKHFPDSVWKDKLDIENTADNYSFVLPASYTPFRAIDWLCGKAYSKTGLEYSPYLFYESIDGHRFKSLSKIIEDGSSNMIRYEYTQGNMPVLEGQKENLGFQSVLPSRYHKVQKLEELSRFDAASNIMNGIISSHLTVHDLVRKEHREHEFYESDVFDSMSKLGNEPHFRANDPEEARVMSRGTSYFYLPSTPYTVYDGANSILDNHQVESLYQKRKYHMNSFLTQKLVIQVFGDSRRRVGDIIDLGVFKPQSDVTALDDKQDKNLSGQYMITSIKHSLAGSYSCKYELSRNGMGV
jgi:hypothetical protein